MEAFKVPQKGLGIDGVASQRSTFQQLGTVPNFLSFIPEGIYRICEAGFNGLVADCQQ
jgi:hypothetical protein